MFERILTLFKLNYCNKCTVSITESTALSAFNYEGIPCRNTKPFQQLIGALMYLSNTTPPEISYETMYFTRNMQNPTEAAWCAAKIVLRYLKGSENMDLRNGQNRNGQVQGYSDYDGFRRPQRGNQFGILVYIRSGSNKLENQTAISGFTEYR